MENDIRSREGLLEPVLPGSAIFDECILPPLHNSYLYEESRKSFIYTSAHLINNDILQKRYAVYRMEKRDSGYTDEELEESFGFLLFEDESQANKLGESGLLTGHSKCSTLGDPTKGVYVSKYSDCLDVKRWYCGKSGHVAIVKLTRGRVKEVSDNYTTHFTAPTEGFDCHESDQLTDVTATTSSFLAFERTQHYLYEFINGGKETEKCPRLACPFAVVTFSYGKAEPVFLELPEKSEEKTVFFYQLWKGQLVVDSLVYEIGLKSNSGALLPAQLPKTLRVKTVISVSDLKMFLPKEIFETCFSGEVVVGGKCCTLYEVVSTDADDGLLSVLTEELKEKDIALVFQLSDGFFVLLHSSYFLSYEDANAEKKEALQGMFVFSDSRAIHQDTKSCQRKSPVSSDILQVLPAFNYAETEMEKSGLEQHEKMSLLEKHLEHYGTLIHPGLQNSPQREASMFPDQYDVPCVFKLLFATPKWTDVTMSQLKSCLDQPKLFEFPVKRATELLLAGREQRRDDPDDEVYYCISSPEEASGSQTSVWFDKLSEAEASCPSNTSEGIETAEKSSDSLTESSAEFKHSDISDPSEVCNAEILNKESRPSLNVSHTTLEVDTEKADISMEITQAAVAVVTPEVLTPTHPKESAILNLCDDQTLQTSSAAQEVMTNESKLPIPKTSTPLVVSEAEIIRTEKDLSLNPEIENKALAQTDCSSLPRRRGRKRKRTSKISVTKMQMNHLLHSPSVTTLATEVQCVGAEQNQHEIQDMDQSHQHKPNSEDKQIGDQMEFLSSNSSTKECLGNSHSHSQEKVERQPSEKETSPKNARKSLPRHCRKDSPTSLPKRGSEEVPEESGKKTTQIHQPKRKIECLRYGLKTIITDCGRIFVPHGQEVHNKDLELVKKQQELDIKEIGLRKSECEPSDRGNSADVNETVDVEVAPKVTEQSSVQVIDKPSSLCQSEQMPHTVHEEHKIGNEFSSKTETALDESTEKIKDSGDSELCVKKKKRNSEYTIISISQLRTVLRRGKKDSSAESEPSLKKLKSGDEKTYVCKSNSDSVSQGQPDQSIQTAEESEGTEPNQKPQKMQNVEEELSAKKHLELSKDLGVAQFGDLSTGDNLPLPNKVSTNTKKRGNAPRRWNKRKANAITGKNKCLIKSPHNSEQLKPTESQTANDLTAHESEELLVGSDERSCSLEEAPMPADALTLLADLALSDNSGQNDKTVHTLRLDKEGKQSQRRRLGLQDSMKGYSSHEAASVLHALLKRPTDAVKLPPSARSPLSTGLVMRGEWVVVISKDHSYSQSPSLLLGLSGAHLKALPLQRLDSVIKQSPVDLPGRSLSSKDDRVLLQHKLSASRNGREQQPPLKKQLPSFIKEKRRSKRHRQIVEKDGSIEVTRVWREQYDFSLDSKFTNDPNDKAVTRALHGPWNFNIKDSPEELHLIFHMWIGLFYSRSPSRFFDVDPVVHNLQDSRYRKFPEEIEINFAPRFSKFSETKVSSQTNTSLLSGEPGNLNVCDEIRKTSVPSSEVLDLSVKGCQPLDLSSVNSKTIESSIERHDSQSLDSPGSEIKSVVSTSTDSEFKIRDLADNSGSVKGDNISVLGIHENASYIKSSNNSASGNSVGNVKKTANVWRDEQTSSDVQRLDCFLGTKELTHVDTIASVAPCDSSHETNTKENTIPAQVHYSSATKSLSPKHTENIVDSKCTTVSIDDENNASPTHEMDIKHNDDEPSMSNVDSSVLSTDSKIETILQAQSDSVQLCDLDTITAVLDQSDSRVQKDDQNNYKSENIATDQHMNNLKDDTIIEQNQSDSNAETTLIMQGSQALKESVTLEVQGPDDSKDKMLKNVPSADSFMTVHGENSNAIMVVADSCDYEGEREVITDKLKDTTAESIMTWQHPAESEKKLLLEHASGPDSDLTISTHHQNKVATSERIKCSKGLDIHLGISVKNLGETSSEGATALLAPKISELQLGIAEQTDNESKLKATGTVQADTDSEIRAVVDLNQSDSKAKELAEMEPGNTEGETQWRATEVELHDLSTDASTSEDNNKYSKDASVMDLNETSVKLNRLTVYSANEYENKVFEDTQRNCNLGCEKSIAGSECLVDPSMEDVEKLDHQHIESMMLPEVATGKAWEDACSHKENVDKDLSLIQPIEPSNQSSSAGPEDKFSADVAEKLPHDLSEQQKTVLTSSLAAHDPCYIKEGHGLTDIGKIRCPTPTIDELPYIPGKGSAPSQGSTPTQDELPSDVGSAGGEERFHEPCSEPYDEAGYNTKGQDLEALSQMIAWFRNEQIHKRDIMSVPSQNSEKFHLKPSTNSESRGKGCWTDDADSSFQFNSSQNLSSSSSGYPEPGVPNTKSYNEWYKDGPVTHQSEDSVPVFQSRYRAHEPFDAMNTDSRDSKSVENLSLRTLSKSASFASTHDNTEKDRREKQRHIYQEEEILDNESVPPTRMKDKQREGAYLKDHHSCKHTHFTKSFCSQTRNPEYTDNLDQTWHFGEDEDHDVLQYGVDSQFKTYHMEESRQSSSTSTDLESSSSDLESSSTEPFTSYRKGEGLQVTVDFKRDYTFSSHKSSLITALDDGDMLMTCKNYSKTAMHSRTIENPCQKGTQRYVETFLHKWDELHQTNDDVTQSSLDCEYIVFSDKMNHILKHSSSKRQQTRNDICRSPVTIQFSRLNEQDTSEEVWDALPMFSESTIKVTLADRKEMREEDSRRMPLRLQRLSCKRETESACSNISAITAEFAKSYYAMMDEVCTNRASVRKTDKIKKFKTPKTVELSGKMKEDLFEQLHDGLNSVVRKACKTKYRFFILVTSDDPFFRETKDLLENEGHIHVDSDQFELETGGGSSPLLIILRNEDISSHICEVPRLLELKKSSSVLFAGIDQPDDFVNLTHQELFGKGGFVVFDQTALNKLTLENMKKIVAFLEKLSKKGKWKWFLHYRDSRRFKENARSQQDVQDRKHFLDCCQDAGIVDVLPYHECDVISRDQANYLQCLVRLQVQNATTRYPVFVTDSPDKAFERNGILTMNMNTFLQILSTDSCTIS